MKSIQRQHSGNVYLTTLSRKIEIEKLDEAAKLDPESLNSSDVPSKVGSWAWAGRRANTKQNI